jgi:3-dehydro-4-phosphotetronate decarboxylase
MTLDTTHDAIDALVRAGARLAASGISPGTSGNVSALDGDRVLMTGTGTDLGRLGRDDVAVLDRTGATIDGPRPSKEVAMHLAMYDRDPSFGATVHVHSPNAMALSCLDPWAPNSAVPPITPYFVMRVGQAPLIPYRMPGDPDLGRLIAEHPSTFRGVLLANHGLVVSGRSLEDAVSAAIEFEEGCRVTLATLGHAPNLLDDAAIAALTAKHGTAWDLPSAR